MFLPIKTDSPLRSTPWVNWGLIALNLVIFFLRDMDPALFYRWSLVPAAPRLHQFITYAFLHEGGLHVAGNMLFLYIFGNNICDRLGNIAYLGFYLSGAVFAGLGYTLFGNAPVIGASGAVAAVTGAYLALLPRSHITLLYWFFIIGMWEVPSLWFIGAYFAYDVLLNLAGNDNVAHMAHISGTVYGFMICMVMLKSNLLPRDHFDMMALVDRWNRRRQYQAVVSTGYDPFSPVQQMRNNRPPMPPVLGEFDAQQELRAGVAQEIARGNMKQAANLYRQLRQRDPGQTLSRGSQLDIANQFYADGAYRDAADAYELFLKSYGNSEQAAQVYLMLGLVCSRYLDDYATARESLREATRLLKSERELDLAKSELIRLEAHNRQNDAE